MKNILLAYLLLLSFFACGQSQNSNVKYPEGYTSQLDVVYNTINGWEGKMDLYLPSKNNVPSPIVINIHGGGWARGSKETQSGFGSFFKAGFAVANISYRLAGTAKAPAAIEDTRCVLIYLINHAKALNIDINKIVIMGSSAGGHLALMGGLLADNSLFDANCKAQEKVKVAAIINKYGVADLSEDAEIEHASSRTVMYWLGNKFTDLSFRKSISPLYHIDKNSPPVFTIHGDTDPTVPYQQSVKLHQKLKSLGVKNQLFTIKGGLHGNFPADQNAEATKQMFDFLKGIGL